MRPVLLLAAITAAGGLTAIVLVIQARIQLRRYNEELRLERLVRDADPEASDEWDAPAELVPTNGRKAVS